MLFSTALFEEWGAAAKVRGNTVVGYAGVVARRSKLRFACILVLSCDRLAGSVLIAHFALFEAHIFQVLFILNETLLG